MALFEEQRQVELSDQSHAKSEQNSKSDILSHAKTITHWLEDLSPLQMTSTLQDEVSGIPFHANSEGAQQGFPEL